MSRLTSWAPIRKVWGIIHTTWITALALLLSQLGAVDWPKELSNDLGPWGMPIGLGLAALIAYITRNTPDGANNPPPGVQFPPPEIPESDTASL